MSREFVKFWLGQSISLVGNQFTIIALPIAAAVTLHATAFEMGLLGAMRFAPGILFGLPAGGLLHRTPRKPILGCSPGVRSIALGTIPSPPLMPRLTIRPLYLR